MQHYLISYDISENKQRNKVFRQLKKVAVPMQKSVFFFDGTSNELRKLEVKIREFLKKGDSLLILPCCANCYQGASLYTNQNDNSVIVA